MLVVIEGVVDSDVSKRGERHEVERTPFLDGLVRNGLVRVVSELAVPKPVAKAEPTRESVVKRRRRTPEPEPEAEPESVSVKFATGGLIEPVEPSVD